MKWYPAHILSNTSVTSLQCVVIIQVVILVLSKFKVDHLLATPSKALHFGGEYFEHVGWNSNHLDINTKILSYNSIGAWLRWDLICCLLLPWYYQFHSPYVASVFEREKYSEIISTIRWHIPHTIKVISSIQHIY